MLVTRRAPAVTDVLQRLTTLTRRLLGPLSLEKVLVTITDEVLHLVNADQATVCVYDESGERLLSSARSGPPSSRGVSPPSVGPDLVAWVVAHGLPVRVEDTQHDPRFGSRTDDGGARSAIVVPLWGRFGVIGVLSAGAEAAGAFAREDELLLGLLGNFAAQALEQPRLDRLAVIDELTLAYTGRYLLPRLQEEMARAWRDGGTLCLLTLRPDQLAGMRAEIGSHEVDRYLRAFVQRIRTSTRPTDVLVREVDDRFSLILSGVPEDRCGAIGDRLRRAVASMRPHGPETQETSGGSTVSIGIATWDGLEPPALLEHRAVKALRQAAEAGGDRVIVAGEATVFAP